MTRDGSVFSSSYLHTDPEFKPKKNRLLPFIGWSSTFWTIPSKLLKVEAKDDLYISAFTKMKIEPQCPKWYGFASLGQVPSLFRVAISF